MSEPTEAQDTTIDTNEKKEKVSGDKNHGGQHVNPDKFIQKL